MGILLRSGSASVSVSEQPVVYYLRRIGTDPSLGCCIDERRIACYTSDGIVSVRVICSRVREPGRIKVMRTICCRCGKEMGTLDSEEVEKNIISHGFCEPCAESFLYEELGKPLHDFLDTLGDPVLLIEPGPKVRTANSQACTLLGKKVSDIQGHKGGEVIECVHSKTPGGCGKDVHCESCTIRNTVLETFASGNSFERVKAYPDIYAIKKVKNACLEISTEKFGEMVLLRIDDLRMND